MGRRTAILALATLACGVLVSATTVVAQETETVEEEPSWEVASCKSLYVEEAGLYKMQLPRWCRGGRCEVFGEWGGNYIGAFSPGLLPPINYIQFPNSAIPNQWVGGPNISFGGISTGGGFGLNGDGNNETILGPYESPDGSFFTLLDDSRKERKSNWVSLLFVKKGDDFEYAKVHICRG